MQILITGGAGFIGSNLAERLINNRDKVTILDIVSVPDNLSLIKDQCTYICGDVRNTKLLENLFLNNNFDGIIHFAAVSRVIWGEEEPQKCKDINITGTRLLLEKIKLNKKRPWFILGSSREVYGEPNKLPVTEDFPKEPINLYGKTKLTGEELVRKYANEQGLKAAILRFSNVYGNEKDIMDRVIPRFVIAALSGKNIEIHGGEQLFDFTHIEDTLNGIIKTIEYLSNHHEINSGSHVEDFHILTGKGTTLQEVVKIISLHLKNKPNVIYTDPRDYDVNKFYGDTSKARKILDFNAEILIQEGIPLTIKQFKEILKV